MVRDSVRLAVGVWLALAVVVAVRTLISPVSHTVFPVFAASAAHWWADEPLYCFYPSLDLFRYPPPFAVALTPFGALGPRAGGILWSWVGMAVYAAGLWRFARRVLPVDWPRGRAAAFLALGAVVALPSLWNAQSNPLVVGLLLLGASAVARGRWWAAAILFAAATWLKLTPLLPAVLLGCLWPRRLAPRFAAALAVGALVPFLTRPPDVVLDHYVAWVSALAHNGGTRWPGFRDGWTAWEVTRAFVRGEPGSRLLLSVDWAGYPWVQLGSAACALAWCLWQRARHPDPRRVLQLALGMGTAWLMLFGPAVEHPTYAFLAPSLAWALLEWRAWPRGRWLIAASFVLIAVLGWDPVVHPLLDRLPLVLAALPVGTALFVAWLIGYARSDDGESRLSPPAPQTVITARAVVTVPRFGDTPARTDRRVAA
ncbi:MAG TPA: glycosyltransferase family 87 protein [Gemmataceae bacterium]|nr:glycosyltransferase family 87 protein [Gemmataceae bacterium]